MSQLSNTMLFALGCGVLGVIYAVFTAIWVSKQDAGSAKMQEISNAVKEGAYAFLAREYKTVAMVAVVLVIVIAAIPSLGMWPAIGFVIGTVGSVLKWSLTDSARQNLSNPLRHPNQAFMSAVCFRDRKTFQRPFPRQAVLWPMPRD